MNQTKAPFSTTSALPKIAYGQGVYLYDITGKQYLDASGGPAVYSLGHAHPEVNEAIKFQLDQVAHGYRFNFTSQPLEDLHDIIARQCGGTLNQVVFVTGGSEAVESSLKIALQYQQAIGQTNRTHFIARRRSYHGNTLGALSVSGYAQRRRLFEGSLLPASFLSPANVYRPPEGVAPEEIADFCAAELEQEILQLGPENVCAFIFEPVVGAAGGVVPAPPNYAARIKAVCEQYGVLLIADEVMCGSGRTGTWRALAYDGVEPDIMAVAKGLGGGYIPLGAAIYREQIQIKLVEAHGSVMTGHTFTNHTTACAAGVAVQRIMEREGLVGKAAADGLFLLNLLQNELGSHPHVGDIRGRGLFIGVEFVADREFKTPFSPDRQLFTRLKTQTFANGLICYPVGGTLDGRQGDVAILAPPYNTTRAQLEEIIDRFVESCNQVLERLET